MSVSLFWKRLPVLHDFYFYKYRCSIPFKCKVVSFNLCYSVVALSMTLSTHFVLCVSVYGTSAWNKTFLFRFRNTSGVCKYVVQDGSKLRVHILTKCWWFLPILSVLYPANNFQWIFMTNLTTSKTYGYTTLKNNCLQKLRRRSTVKSDKTCAYWRE